MTSSEDQQRPLDDDERALVEAHLDLVDEVASQQAWRLVRLERDDLTSVGRVGLIQAAQRYDPGQGVPFRGFAYYRIRGAMIDHARRLDRPGRRTAEAVRALETTQSLLENAQQDLSQEARLDLRARVHKAQEIVHRAAAALAMSHALSDGLEETAPSQEDDPERSLGRQRLRARLMELLGTLEGDDRDLIHLVYIEGLSLSACARRRGLHASTISRQHARILARLATELAPSRDDTPPT